MALRLREGFAEKEKKKESRNSFTLKAIPCFPLSPLLKCVRLPTVSQSVSERRSLTRRKWIFDPLSPTYSGCICDDLIRYLFLSDVSDISASPSSPPGLTVVTVEGGRAELPCDITAPMRGDSVYLVLWYRKDYSGTPIYR